MTTAERDFAQKAAEGAKGVGSFKHVSVVSVGPGDPEMMTLACARALRDADVVVGAARLLESLPEGSCARRVSESRTSAVVEILRADSGWERACFAVSGDAGFHSAARLFLKECEPCGWDVCVMPGVGSVQVFSARLGKPWHNWRFASAHGEHCDVASMATEDAPLFLIAGKGNSVACMCADLVAAGKGDWRVSVGEHLSYPDERIVSKTAAELADGEFDYLCVMLVEAPKIVGNEGNAPLWPYASMGIPDDLFVRGRAPMTKQEVRAVALSKLKVARTDVVYDVGAGTGSVSVEAALLAREGAVYAVERAAESAELVRENARRFGTANLHVVQGLAPEALAGLPAPDAVFVGGSAGNLKGIVSAVRALNPQVRICVACVTLETLAEAVSVLGGEGFADFDAACVNAARADKLGGYHLMRAQNPVHLISARAAVAQKGFADAPLPSEPEAVR